MTNSKSSLTKQQKNQQQKPLNQKESTRSLEESLDLVPLDPKWSYERSSPYGEFYSESTTTSGKTTILVASFSKGELVVVKRNEKEIFKQFLENKVNG